MSASAIQNLSESLDLIECTIEAILNKEAEFQTMMAQKVAVADDPKEYIESYSKNQTMVKISLIRAGETQGISNTGETFSEEGLDFSAGGAIGGLEVSRSYMNYMGTWAYTMKCPVEKDGRQIAALYVEYVYDSFDKSLPNGFYVYYGCSKPADGAQTKRDGRAQRRAFEFGRFFQGKRYFGSGFAGGSFRLYKKR